MYICNEDGEIQYANKKFKEHYCINSQEDENIIKSSFIKIEIKICERYYQNRDSCFLNANI